MHSLRRLLATVTMQDVDPESIAHELQTAGVPISNAACRSCPDPCTEGHDSYPDRFDVDLETRLLGSQKPFNRQVVISTGKSDWVREVTEESGSLAAHLSHIATSSHHKKESTHVKDSAEPQPPSNTPGLFTRSDSTRISILNGSHHSLSESPSQKETVLVFPDFLVLNEVHRTPAGAQDLWNKAVNPATIVPCSSHKEDSESLDSRDVLSFPLPYSVVILLCSHKKRDNRCSIAAPKLERGLTESLEAKGWTVDTQIDHHSLGEPLESFTDSSDGANYLATQLQQHSTSTDKRALIIKVSHIGGHKYVGNVIIYLPNRKGIYYGRVTPHEIESIITNTIEKGQILPALLRGGLNIVQPGHQSLHEW